MSNPPLFPYQQGLVDRLKALGTERRIYEFPVGGNRLGLRSADRVTPERAERLILDLKMANDHRAADAVQALDMAVDVEHNVLGLNPRHLRNAMFGIRYGKTWAGGNSHLDNAKAFWKQEIPDVPPRRALMYYHVQHALMGWSKNV